MPKGRHPDYEDVIEFVKGMRDAFQGSKQIKAEGDTYLFRPSGYTDDEFKAYMHRAEYLPTVSRTHAGLMGRAFNETPDLEHDGQLDLDTLDTSGESFGRTLRWVLDEVLLVASCGLLAEYDDSPKLARYKREHILDWHFENATLTYLVLDQSRMVFEAGERSWLEEHLEFRLEEGAVVAELWCQEGDEQKEQWVSQETFFPQATGVRLTEIPFRFIGDPKACESILSPIAELVLDYYDLSAQERWLLSKVASPQFTIQWERETDVGTATEFLETNMSQDGAIHIGAGSILQLLGASAYYVEVSGAGIEKIKEAKKETKSQLIAAGARSLADQTQSNLATDTVRIQNSGEGAILSDLVDIVGTDVSLFMLHVATYSGEAAVKIKFSKNFFSEKLSMADLLQVVGAWQSGALPLESVHEAATQAGLTEDDFEQYVEKLGPQL